MKVEDEALRQATLDISGEVLNFTGFSIKGYPGFSTARLYDGETSLYHVERTEYSFFVTTKDARTNNIAKGNRFSFSDETYIFTFELEADPLTDLTGYSKLRVNFKGRVDV